jgi:hypothetical protein
MFITLPTSGLSRPTTDGMNEDTALFDPEGNDSKVLCI